MKLTEDKLRQIIREEILSERNVAAHGEDGGHVKVQKDVDTGGVLMDVSPSNDIGEYRLRLLPGEAMNLANNLERIAKF